MTACFANVDTKVDQYDSRDVAPEEVRKASLHGDPSAMHYDAEGRAHMSLFRDRFASQSAVSDAMRGMLLSHFGVDQLLGAPAMGEVGTRIAVEAYGPGKARRLGERIILEGDRFGADPELAKALKDARAQFPTSGPTGIARAVLARVLTDPKIADTAGTRRVVNAVRAGLEVAGLRAPDGRLTAEDLRRFMREVQAYADAVPNSAEAKDAAYRAREAGNRIYDAPDKAGEIQRTVEEGQEIKQTWFSYIANGLLDERWPIMNLMAMAAHYLPESFGRSQIWNLTKTLGNCGQNAMNVTFHKYYSPVLKIMKTEGRKIGQAVDEVSKRVGQYMAALHVAERNERIWLMQVELNDSATLARIEFLDNAAQNKAKFADIRDDLYTIVTSGSPRIPLKDATYAGMYTAEAKDLLARYDADPDYAAARAAIPAFKAARDHMIANKLKAGLTSQAVIDLYGYEHYVPMRGRRVDSASIALSEIHKALKLGEGEMADLTAVRRTREAKGRGAGNMAEDVFTTVMYDGLDASRLGETQSLLQEIGRTFMAMRTNEKRPLYMGIVIDDGVMRYDSNSKTFQPEGFRQRSKIGRSYNAIPFMGADGRTKTLITMEEKLARTLNEVVAPTDNMSVAGKAAKNLTSLYGQTLTRYNPYFWAFQYGRDILNNVTTLLFTDVGITGFDRIRAATKFGKNLTEVLADGKLRDYMFAKSEEKRIERWLDPSLRDQRSMFAEFVDDGGRTRLANMHGQVLNGKLQPEAAQKLAPYLEYVQAVTEGMEISHRYAFYKTMREMGIDRADAARHTVDLMDFSQRSAVSRGFSYLYPFANVINAAFSRFGSQAIWKNGEIPRKFVDTPTGAVEPRFDAANALKNLNYKPVLYAITAGIAGAALSDMMLGNDDDGESVYGKQAANLAVRNFFVPSGDPKAPGVISMSENAHSGIFAFGQLLYRSMMGYDDAETTGYAMGNNIAYYFTPVLKGNTQFNDVPMGGSTLTDVALGMTPGVLTAPMRDLLNVDAFGRPLDRRGQMVNVEGMDVTLGSGPEATTPQGEPYQAVGETFGVSGDAAREWLGMLGFPAAFVDRILQSDVRAEQTGEDQNLMGDLVSRIFFKTTASGMASPMRDKLNAMEPFQEHAVILAELQKEDQEAGEGGAMIGGKRSRGPRMDAYIADHPFMDYYVDYRNFREQEERDDPDYTSIGTYNVQIQQAAHLGQTERLQQLRHDAEVRNEEDEKVYLKLWKAGAEWERNGSVKEDWPQYLEEAGLRDVKHRVRPVYERR